MLTRPITFTPRAILIYFVAILGALSAQEDERENYRRLFGSNIVPTYASFGEPEAPHPFVYVVATREGKIAAIRRPITRGVRDWRFEELSSKFLSDGRIDEKEAAFVVVADKDLGRERFLRLITELEKKTRRTALWIQVWGIHPYPLQIRVELGKEDLKERFKGCKDLQEVVYRLHGRDANGRSIRQRSPKKAEQD